MFEPGIEMWAGCGLDQLPKSRLFRAIRERRDDAAAGHEPVSEAGYAEGYAQGLADGAAVQADRSQAREAALEALVERMESLARLPAGSVELLLTEAAKRIADAIEVELDGTTGPIGELITRLAAAIESEHAIVAVHLNNADQALAQALAMPFLLQADDSVPAGCVRIRTEAGWLEDGPVLRLHRFRAALDRQAGL